MHNSLVEVYSNLARVVLTLKIMRDLPEIQKSLSIWYFVRLPHQDEGHFLPQDQAWVSVQRWDFQTSSPPPATGWDIISVLSAKGRAGQMWSKPAGEKQSGSLNRRARQTQREEGGRTHGCRSGVSRGSLLRRPLPRSSGNFGHPPARSLRKTNTNSSLVQQAG